MTDAADWLTAAEMAELLGITVQAFNARVRESGWRAPERLCCTDNPGGVWRRPPAGGGYLYHYALLPATAQAKWLKRRAPEPERPARPTLTEPWERFERLSDARKEVARKRLRVLQAVERLVRGGVAKVLAAQLVGEMPELDASPASIFNWYRRIAGVAEADWLPHLADAYSGRTTTVDCDPDAWDFLRSDFLRLERPSLSTCLRRLQQTARERGWSLPSDGTLRRRIDDIPLAVRVLARDGVEKMKRLYPAQERDRSKFHALEGANADGHKWDVWVQWPGQDEPIRPVMVAIQDLYSGMIIGWRVDRTENKEAVRLAIGDMVDDFGIPSYMWLDNGRGFASKWITGGTPTRYRFKVRDEDPNGLLTDLGVEVHWATPYHGQAKPIERAFRDMCDAIARHPAFAGAWSGDRPDAKPENYRSKAVPLDAFLKVVAEGIAEHNTRTKRRTAVCGGVHSFAEVFNASYAVSPIRRPTEAQKRLWLLAAEGVRATGDEGSIKLLGNRYWAEFLLEHRGQSLVVRFDPQQLHQPLHVYRLAGGYLGAAGCVEAVGFADVEEGRAHQQARNAFARHTRAALAAERRLSPEQVAAMLPRIADAPAPETKVVRPVFRTAGSAALKAAPAPAPVQGIDFEAAFAAGAARLRLVEND